MIGVEFMTGAMFFALVNLIIFLVFAYILIRIGRKFWVFANIDDEVKHLNIKKEVFALGGLIIFFIFFGSLTQPKVTINTLPNRSLMEYQENDTEVVIETPAPRTETLEGFEPLKKE